MKIRTLLLSFAAASALASCSTQTVLPRFEVSVIDTLLGTPDASCRIEYRFASIANAACSPVLQTIEQANIGYFFGLEEFSGTVAQAQDSILRETVSDFLPEKNSTIVRQYEFVAQAEGVVVDTLVCYAINRSSYTGGAHGAYSTEYHTYSLADGYELSTADLFPEEQLEALGRLIRTKLYEQYDVQDDAGLAAQGFFPEQICLTENFRVTTEGITFHYNPYDIGCYALGSIEVTISREELARL